MTHLKQWMSRHLPAQLLQFLPLGKEGRLHQLISQQA